MARSPRPEPPARPVTAAPRPAAPLPDGALPALAPAVPGVLVGRFGVREISSITNAAAFGPLLKARLLSRRTNPTAIVQTQSPVHFLITDPSGHRLGWGAGA